MAASSWRANGTKPRNAGGGTSAPMPHRTRHAGGTAAPWLRPLAAMRCLSSANDQASVASRDAGGWDHAILTKPKRKRKTPVVRTNVGRTASSRPVGSSRGDVSS